MARRGKQQDSFGQLVEVVRRLRSPDGCPWDREQTLESIRGLLVEEAYEVLDAGEARDREKLKEELGDLLMQILFHAELCREEGNFDIFDVVETLKDKMVRRHPHVFGGKKKKNAREVLAYWEGAKRKESGNRSVMAGVPRALPALLRAWRVQKKAARVGFEWKRIGSIRRKWEEEAREFREARGEKDRGRMEKEIGDLLFTLANLARFLKINPEDALQRSTNRFLDRFRHIEEKLDRTRRTFSDVPLPTLERYWKEAKKIYP